MSSAPEIRSEHHLGFYFETNEGISPRSLGHFLTEVERIAKTQSFFGSQAKLEIVKVGTGTLWVEIAIDVGTATLGGVGTLILQSLASSIKERFRRRTGKLPEALASMALDNGVVQAQVITKDARYTIEKGDFGAIETVQRKRLPPTGYGLNRGNDYGGASVRRPRSIEGALPAQRLDDSGDDARGSRTSESNWKSYFDGSYGPLTPSSENAEESVGNPHRVAAGTRRPPNIAIMGEFVKVAGANAAIFQTGDADLDVKLPGSQTYSQLPFGRRATVIGVVEGNTVFVQGWTFVEGGKAAQ